MESKEFVINELKKFIKQFPRAMVRYEHHEPTNAHFVEVLPNEIYHFDKDYISWENNTWDKFVKEYPCEGFCCFTDNDMFELENVELTLRGADYAKAPTEKNIHFRPVSGIQPAFA